MRNISSSAPHRGESHSWMSLEKKRWENIHDNLEWSKYIKITLLGYGRVAEGNSSLSKHTLCIEMIFLGYMLLVAGLIPPNLIPLWHLIIICVYIMLNPVHKLELNYAWRHHKVVFPPTSLPWWKWRVTILFPVNYCGERSVFLQPFHLLKVLCLQARKWNITFADSSTKFRQWGLCVKLDVFWSIPRTTTSLGPLEGTRGCCLPGEKRTGVTSHPSSSLDAGWRQRE